MPQTMEISSAVGTTWKTTEESKKEIPLRSGIQVSPLQTS